MIRLVTTVALLLLLAGCACGGNMGWFPSYDCGLLQAGR